MILFPINKFFAKETTLRYLKGVIRVTFNKIYIRLQ